MPSIDLQLENQAELIRDFQKLAGPRMRKVAKRVTKAAMVPVLQLAKAWVPVESGRLRASLGQLASTNKRGDAFSSRVGTRRDFTYTDTSNEKMVSGRGKTRDRAIARGYAQDRKSAQQYARLIEFGEDSSGRKTRAAGPAHFLENAIRAQEDLIEVKIAGDLRREIDATT